MKAEKKELQAKFHRELIIDTAEKLFMADGVSNTTTDKIAKEAGYSKSTMYVYFKSKEEIYNHIILRGMNILKAGFEAAVNQVKDFKDRYYDLCFALSAFQEKYPLHFDGVLGNISLDFDGKNEDDILYRIFLAGEEINKLIGGFISEGMESGIIRKGLKLNEAIFTFWASISGIVKLAGQKTAYIEMQIKTTKNEFLKYSFSLLFDSIREKWND